MQTQTHKKATRPTRVSIRIHRITRKGSTVILDTQNRWVLGALFTLESEKAAFLFERKIARMGFKLGIQTGPHSATARKRGTKTNECGINFDKYGTVRTAVVLRRPSEVILAGDWPIEYQKSITELLNSAHRP